ncbi:hypothetical protein MGE_01641, partial [Candida albicans P75010]
SKKKQSYYDEEVRTLPSGAPVDFGHGKKSTSKPKSKSKPASSSTTNFKLTASPSLPSGAKPNFQPYKSTSPPPPPPPPPPSTQPSTSTSTSPTPRTSNGNKNHHNRHQSNHSDYDNDHPQLSLPNGKKPNFFNNNNNDKKFSTIPFDSSINLIRKQYNNPNTKAIKEKKLDNNNNNNSSNNSNNSNSAYYAGSSFHSSPDAFNLPKPSFKSNNGSPRQSSGLRDY